MAIDYEADLLKHHVRTNAWLPICKNRLKMIRESDPSRIKRRLKYFTFCAVGAMDVLMLDVAKIIRRSNGGRFDTVVFFDRDEDLVLKTQRRIPGAIGFPGDFARVVLLDDPDEGIVIAGQDSLLPQENNEDNVQVRRQQVLIAQHQDFIRRFPFDVINLDLEEFLFKPTDPLPGRVVNALRKVFEWQCRGFFTRQNGVQQFLDGFSLMFTTRIGPDNISEEYLDMLRGYLEDNLHNNETLIPVFLGRTGGVENVSDLQRDNFELFFRLAIPKVISSILIESDWYIDPDNGVSIFEFERTPPNSPPYKMLHLVMDVRRQMPVRIHRAPRVRLAPEVQDAYEVVVRQIFAGREIFLTIDNIEQDILQENLAQIIARRRLYCPDDD